MFETLFHSENTGSNPVGTAKKNLVIFIITRFLLLIVRLACDQYFSLPEKT